MRPTACALLLFAFHALFAGCLVGERPVEPDSDTDGLPDRIETEGWPLWVEVGAVGCLGAAPPVPANETRLVQSNPLREDTDADGVPDGAEYSARSDPNRTDTDGDNLTDLEEYELRADPSLFVGLLLALHKVDSDGDCLRDDEELEGIVVPGIGNRTTDPTTNDSDHDGLTDPWEVLRSRTDPTDADTDNDGAEDRFDADPLRDLWLRFALERIRVKQASSSNETNLHVILHWSVPSVPPMSRPTPTPRFLVRLEETTTIPANNSPGLFDLEDRQGSSLVQLQVWGSLVDGSGRPKGLLGFHPTEPDQIATLRLDAETGKWAVREREAPEVYSAFGRIGVLESDQARLEFSLELTGPPG